MLWESQLNKTNPPVNREVHIVKTDQVKQSKCSTIVEFTVLVIIMHFVFMKRAAYVHSVVSYFAII